MDGAGKVDGSVVVALPVDRWSGPEEENSFIGHGGGLTFWDGKDMETNQPKEIHYETRSGDLAFIDRYVTFLRDEDHSSLCTCHVIVTYIQYSSNTLLVYGLERFGIRQIQSPKALVGH